MTDYLRKACASMLLFILLEHITATLMEFGAGILPDVLSTVKEP
jgi:hypothetical protein